MSAEIPACQHCRSERFASLGAKCSDLCDVSVAESSHSGYVPGDMGIGGGDYVEITWCLDCGRIQGEFPLPLCKLEREKVQ